MDEISDNQLMAMVRDGDLDKLGILFERYHVMLYNFFLRLTEVRELSEDLVQEVFLRILSYRHTYAGRGKFTTWLFQIARNARIDHFRKTKNNPVNQHEFNAEKSTDSSPLENLDQQEQKKLIQQALSKLDMDVKEIIVMSRFHNLKYHEIAELVNCPVGTIKAKVHRGLKDLRSIYLGLTRESLI